MYGRTSTVASDRRYFEYLSTKFLKYPTKSNSDTGSQIAAPIQDNRRHFSPTLRTRGLRQCAALTQALSHAIGQGMNLIAIFGAASGMVNNQAKGEGCWEGAA